MLGNLGILRLWVQMSELVNGPLCMIVGATDCEYFFISLNILN